VHKHPRNTLTDWFELAIRLGRQEGVDVYHGFFLAYAGFVAAYAARLLGVPSVVSARGNDLDRLIFDAARAPFILETLRLADIVTAVSSELAAKAAALAPHATVCHVPNGVDADLFCPGSAAPRWELGPGAALGFVGEARVKKGLAVLLDAFAQVATAHSAHLILVGGVREKDCPILNLFRRQRSNLSIQVVPYLDHEQLPGVYSALDLVLLPSFRDGLPNGLLEAMACAKPVVATSVGGIADAIQDGVNGFLVPPGDSDALARRVLSLLDDPIACQAVGAAARETVLQAYTPQHELEANLAVYRELGLL
jgi:glycosyltransferase involved in cell wall biosynthesis